MVDCHNENHMVRLNRKKFDIRASEFHSSKHVKKLMNVSKLGDKEVDPDYAWFLEFLTNTNGQTNIIKDKDHGKYDDEYDDEDEKDNDIDPQYSWFLKGLTENGRSYKLKISQNDETPCFLEYEESDGYEPPTDTNISLGNKGDNVNSSEDTVPMQINQRVNVNSSEDTMPMQIDQRVNMNSSEDTVPRQIDRRVKSSLPLGNGKMTTKEVSGKKKSNMRKSKTEPHRITAGSCYQLLLDGCVPSEYGAFDYEGKQVKYEETGTSSDSEIQMWENVKDYSEVNNKQAASAEKNPSLKEKLMLILKKPYDKEEYEELLKYAEQKKPICRLLPLRGRSVSSAMDGVTKSVLDDVPGIKKKLKDVRNDRPRALNLLRMLRFWLEYLPNQDSFKPWADEDCLRVRPSRHRT